MLARYRKPGVYNSSLPFGILLIKKRESLLNTICTEDGELGMIKAKILTPIRSSSGSPRRV